MGNLLSLKLKEENCHLMETFSNYPTRQFVKYFFRDILNYTRFQSKDVKRIKLIDILIFQRNL